jgi:hypothetical protein
MAKWLLTLGDKIDIHYSDDKAFIKACENGHLAVAQWLYYFDGKINIRSQNDKAFKEACSNKHLNVGLWLKSLCHYYQVEYKITKCRIHYDQYIIDDIKIDYDDEDEDK